jgi:DNA invertase Pin-like site-specific DNA recombinase
MWQMVGILAELERSLIQERTKAGRAAAKARGVKMGRKPLLSAQQVAHARKLREQGEKPGTGRAFTQGVAAHAGKGFTLIFSCPGF